MSFAFRKSGAGSARLPHACRAARLHFSPYLDGGLSGATRARVAQHLTSCAVCAKEFEGWRTVQHSLAALGSARAPEGLQAQLRNALRSEREQNTHLPPMGRLHLLARNILAPAALRLAGGLSIALVLLGSTMLMYTPSSTVQANDSGMAHVTAPRFLYSQVPLEAVNTRHDVPVLVEAKVNTRGRVYDYVIVAGPKDSTVQRRVEENLVASMFKPATAFGVPVPGHVVITYTGVSVRG